MNNKNFSEAVEIAKKVKGLKKEEYKTSGRYPVIDQGQEKISAYSDAEEYIQNELPFIIFGDHTRILKYINFRSILSNDGVKILRGKQGVDTQFLYYLLSSFDIPNTGYNRHFKFLVEKSLNIPSFEIQLKIAAIFSIVDAAIEETDQIIQKTELLKQGLMQKFFDENGKSNWRLEKLGNMTNFIDYRGKTPTKASFGVHLITAKNVRMGYVDPDPREYIKSEDYDTWMTRGIPKKGDVLFTTEAPLGNVAQIDTDEKVAFAQRVIILQPKQNLSPSFLKYLLMSYQFQKLIQSLGTGGTVKGIKAKILREIEISVPLRDEQDRIVNILIAIDYKLDNEKKTKKQLIKIKDGLMKDIFNQKVQIN